MAGSGAGFLAGLAEGFGGAVLDNKKRKHDEELERSRELSSLYLNGVFSGSIRPETGYTEFAKIVTPILSGDDSGKGKGKGLFGKFFKEPENLGKLMAGLHEGLGVVPPFAGTKPDTSAPTSASENGELPSQSSAVQSRGSTPPGLAGILVSPEERQQQQIALKEGEAEAGAIGADRGRMRAAEDLARRYNIPIDEAMQRVGLKEPAAVRPGSPAAIVQDALDAFSMENNRPPTPQERKDIAVKTLKELKANQASSKAGLSGEAAQAYDEVLMSRGVDPRTYQPVDEQEKKALLQQSGAILRARRLKEDVGADADAETFDGSRPDPKNANTVNPKTGLTPNAQYQDAVIFALENRMPSFGLGSASQVRNARAAIQNKAAAIAEQAGIDLPTLQAEYRANSTALNRLVPQYRATAGFAGTAKDNLDLALKQSANVPRTGSPLANRYLQWANGQSLKGNPELTKFETYIYTAAREYAKVTQGAAMSAAGLTDSAAAEATKLLNAAQTPQAFVAAVTAMKNDMANVIGNQSDQINTVSSTIAQFLVATTTAPIGTTGSGRSVPASKSTGGGSGVFMGTDGQLHTGSPTGPVYKPGG